jgi:hypothetical protein
VLLRIVVKGPAILELRNDVIGDRVMKSHFGSLRRRGAIAGFPEKPA